MTVDIVVYRNAGLNQGDDIVDRLITSTAVALERGRAELDDRATQKEDVDNTTVLRSGVRLGQLVEINDSLQGRTYRGKITAITHRIGQTSVKTTISIRREGDFA